jgi:hypothetical protein
MRMIAPAPPPGRKRTAYRSGKVAMLPFTVREEVCQRMLDGQNSTEILPWLNSLPVVRERLAVRYPGRLISHQNLYDWRHGGYADWLRERQLNGSGAN